MLQVCRENVIGQLEVESVHIVDGNIHSYGIKEKKPYSTLISTAGIDARLGGIEVWFCISLGDIYIHQDVEKISSFVIATKNKLYVDSMDTFLNISPARKEHHVPVNVNKILHVAGNVAMEIRCRELIIGGVKAESFLSLQYEHNSVSSMITFVDDYIVINILGLVIRNNDYDDIKKFLLLSEDVVTRTFLMHIYNHVMRTSHTNAHIKSMDEQKEYLDVYDGELTSPIHGFIAFVNGTINIPSIYTSKYCIATYNIYVGRDNFLDRGYLRGDELESIYGKIELNNVVLSYNKLKAHRIDISNSIISPKNGTIEFYTHMLTIDGEIISEYIYDNDTGIFYTKNFVLLKGIKIPIKEFENLAYKPFTNLLRKKLANDPQIVHDFRS